MATHRSCFLVDISFIKDISPIFCSATINIKNQLSKYRKSYTISIPPIFEGGVVVYTTDILQRIKAAVLKLRSCHLTENIPKLEVKK